MNGQSTPEDARGDSAQPTVFVTLTILALMIVMVGGTFLYDGLFVQRGVPMDPIEMYAGEGSPTILLEMKAASTIGTPEFPTEIVDEQGRALFISDEVGITNDDVSSAGVREQDGNWTLVIHFTEAGAEKMTALTTSLATDEPDIATARLAILLDGKLRGAPKVIAPVDGGVGQIHLSGLDEARGIQLAKGVVGAE